MKVSKEKQLVKMKEELVFTILKYRDAMADLIEGTIDVDDEKQVFVWEYEDDGELKQKELDCEKDWQKIAELIFKKSLEEDEDMCMVNLCAIGEYLDGESDKLVLLVKQDGEIDTVDLTDSELWDEFLPMIRTNGGDYVCTISEAIIAENLFKRDIDYKYREPMTLEDGRKIYPTFTLYDNETGEKKYIEHIEMFEDERRADELCSNQYAYLEKNLLYGRDVVLSLETREHPLDIERVMSGVDRMFFGDITA